jgi:hypothetical protein
LNKKTFVKKKEAVPERDASFIVFDITRNLKPGTFFQITPLSVLSFFSLAG